MIDKKIKLQGQDGYSSEMEAFMLNDKTMVIYGEEHQLAYLDIEQAKIMFNLTDSPCSDPIKARAEIIRMELMQLSDEDLTFAQAESFGTNFKSLAEKLVDMAEAAKRDVPF